MEKEAKTARRSGPERIFYWRGLASFLNARLSQQRDSAVRLCGYPVALKLTFLRHARSSLVSRFLRYILFMFSAMLATAIVAGQRAAACELCRALGTTAYHIPAMGGDDSNDALNAPAPDATPDPLDVNDDGLSVGVAQPAYVTVGARWPSNGPNGSVTLTYSYENMFDGALKMKNGQPLPAYIIRKSIETALQLWANVVPISFVEVPDDGLGYGLSTQFGQLRFRHVYINGPDPPDPALPIAKAQAYFPGGGDYSGDVEFDHGDPWEVVGTLHEPDILGAATHEIGHTLGLNHTDVIGANMYWIFRRSAGLNDGWLHPDDIAGIQSIYGSGSGTVTPLFAVPEPATWMLLLASLISLLAASRVRSRIRKNSGSL
jgi:Matrixin